MVRARRRSLSDLRAVGSLLILSLGGLMACQVSEGRELILEERARYSAQVVSWAGRDDGRIVASIRIWGPVRSRLEILTLEIQGRDPQGAVVLSEWRTFDVSGMPMGTPKEETLILDVGEQMPDGLTVLLHPTPGPEVLPRLRELEGVH